MSFSFIVILGLLTYTSISQTINDEIYNHIALAQEQSPPLTNSTLVDLIGTGILGPLELPIIAIIAYGMTITYHLYVLLDTANYPI